MQLNVLVIVANGWQTGEYRQSTILKVDARALLPSRYLLVPNWLVKISINLLVDPLATMRTKQSRWPTTHGLGHFNILLRGRNRFGSKPSEQANSSWTRIASDGTKATSRLTIGEQKAAAANVERRHRRRNSGSGASLSLKVSWTSENCGSLSSLTVGPGALKMVYPLGLVRRGVDHPMSTNRHIKRHWHTFS